MMQAAFPQPPHLSWATTRKIPVSLQPSASYSAGGLSVNYATDEESAWDVNASYALGGGATAFVGSNSTEFSVGGVEFTF